MSNNSEIIYDALSLLGVVSETEALSASDAVLGLRVLNDLLAEWDTNGIDVGHWPQTDATAEFPAGPSLHLAVKFNLAVHLAPHYQRTVSAPVALAAGASYQRLLRDAVINQMRPSDMTHIPRGEGGLWDVTSDEFS